MTTTDYDFLAIAEHHCQKTIISTLNSDLAEGWQLQVGDKIEVPDMQDCDCIPIRIRLTHSKWDLIEVRTGWSSKITAIYRCWCSK